MPNIDPNSNLSFSYNRKTGPYDITRGYKVSNGFSKLLCDILTHNWSPCIWSPQKTPTVATTKRPLDSVDAKLGYRGNENFLYADFLALDFDDPGITMAEMAQEYRDHAFIIAPTQSNMILKMNARLKRDIICERFRFVAPLERRIVCPDEYRATVEYYQKKHSTDDSTTDPGRYFKPSISIYAFNLPDVDDSPIGDWETVSVIAAKKKKEYKGVHSTFGNKKLIPKKETNDLIQNGRLFPGLARNSSIFEASCDLFRCGRDFDDVIYTMRIINIDRSDTNGKEFNSDEPVKSAWSTVTAGSSRGSDI
jgi:hypothetical protein